MKLITCFMFEVPSLACISSYTILRLSFCLRRQKFTVLQYTPKLISYNLAFINSLSFTSFSAFRYQTIANSTGLKKDYLIVNYPFVIPVDGRPNLILYSLLAKSWQYAQSESLLHNCETNCSSPFPTSFPT